MGGTLDDQTGVPMDRRLIVFTRYPEPGKTKTRLIPTLGAEAAASLQSEMTRHILDVARQLSARISLALEIRFEGGDRERMEARFGSEFLYRPQGTGDLGCRLQRAFAEASSGDVDRVVVVGADCPDITAELLEETFEQLSTKDLVVGPASDGGYYLIGLRQPAPELFTGVSWGSDQVLEQTLCRAQQLSLEVGLLRTLSDVDRPDDLAVWHRAKRLSSVAPTTQISVIIPTLNEAEYLPHALGSLRDAENVEAIVVDGGSTDGTPDEAKRRDCRVLHSPVGRALQMNAAARGASGAVLLFLHADTRLPPGFDSALLAAIQEPGVVGGAFRLHIDAPGLSLRAIERAVNIRSRLLQMPYGDQGIFVRSETFHEVGGFPALPVMEDFEFVRRLRRRGRIRIVSLPVTTSGRRWQELGPWRTTWINQKVILGYYLGVSPERLARW